MEKILQQILSELQELKANQSETNARFDGIDRRLDGMDKRLDGMDKRMDRMQDSMDALSADVATHNNYTAPLMKLINEKLDGQKGKLERLDALEATAREHHERLWVLEHTRQ